MPNTKTVHVPHLGGVDAAYVVTHPYLTGCRRTDIKRRSSYQMPRPYDASKPTLVLVNSFTTSSELYRGQYADEELNKAMNLISIE